MIAPPLARLPEPDLLRRRAAYRHMRGDDRDAAAARCAAIAATSSSTAAASSDTVGSSSSHSGRSRRDEAGKREPPLLAGRKIAGGDVGQRVEREPLQRASTRAARSAGRRDKPPRTRGSPPPSGAT